jgi:integrase
MIGKKGVRDRALTLLGFRAALRRSELVALDVADFALSGEGMLITVRRSKTDQEGRGRTIAIPYCKAACAVTALLEWLDVADVEAGALFPSLDRAGKARGRLPAQSVSLILRGYAKAAGVEVGRLSAHSLRAGFVTTAAKAGIQVHAIQRQTGHKSIETLFRYVRTSNPFTGNANRDLDSP